jgi:predicted ATPase
VDRIETLHGLLIATFRPEFNPPWIGQPHVTAMTVNRLTQREVGAMVDRVVGNKPSGNTPSRSVGAGPTAYGCRSSISP